MLSFKLVVKIITCEEVKGTIDFEISLISFTYSQKFYLVTVIYYAKPSLL